MKKLLLRSPTPSYYASLQFLPASKDGYKGRKYPSSFFILIAEMGESVPHVRG